MKIASMAGVLLGALVCASGVLAQTDATIAPPKPEPAQPAEPPKQEEKLVYVKMATSMGDIILELNAEKAPVTVKNFMKYVEKGHYDGTIFHRVIPDFVIQGGGFTADMKQKPTEPPIKNEWGNGLKNLRGTISMARTSDLNSATSQFFINVSNNDGTVKYNLDDPRGGGYAVFGKVVAGIEVVDKIKAVKTTSKGGHQDVPAEPVSIKKATKITKEEADKAAGPGSGG